MLRLRVPTMRCGGCASAVRQALAPVPGVEEVRIDAAQRVVEVCGPAEVGPVCAALRAAGYPVTEAERLAMAMGAAG